MSATWPYASVGELCTVINGGTPRTGVQDYWGGENLWITPAEMGGRLDPYVDNTQRKLTDSGLSNSSARVLPPNSIILSSRAPIGHLVINSRPMATNQGCKGLIPCRQLHHKFLFYYLTNIVDQLRRLGTGATFSELSSAKLKDVPVPIAPIVEQERIVDVLDEAFKGIASARATAGASLRNAEALFESQVRSIFSDAWRTGETVPLADLTAAITDGDHMPPPKSSSGIPFITIGDIVKETRQVDFTNTFMVPRQYFDSLKPSRKPRGGDVLYTVTGATLGIPVLVREDVPFCFQRHIALVRPNSETDSRWLYYLLLSPQVFKQASERATGTAQKTVALRVLRSLEVPRVPLPRQRQMVEALDRMALETQRLTSIYRRKLAALDELKQSLLHHAFTGQL